MGGWRTASRPVGNPGRLEANEPTALFICNGNGRPHFGDVTFYFSHMGEFTGDESLAEYDYNGNNRIDFGDVVWLFRNS